MKSHNLAEWLLLRDYDHFKANFENNEPILTSSQVGRVNINFDRNNMLLWEVELVGSSQGVIKLENGETKPFRSSVEKRKFDIQIKYHSKHPCEPPIITLLKSKRNMMNRKPRYLQIDDEWQFRFKLINRVSSFIFVYITIICINIFIFLI